MDHVLFLCSKNKWRSLTAETIFKDLPNYHVRSAGTENGARVKVSPGLIGWADIIFCMEKKHVRRIRDKYGDMLGDKKLICLQIPDDYQYMDETLIELLIASVAQYLDI